MTLHSALGKGYYIMDFAYCFHIVFVIWKKKKLSLKKNFFLCNHRQVEPTLMGKYRHIADSELPKVAGRLSSYILSPSIVKSGLSTDYI